MIKEISSGHFKRKMISSNQGHLHLSIVIASLQEHNSELHQNHQKHLPDRLQLEKLLIDRATAQNSLQSHTNLIILKEIPLNPTPKIQNLHFKQQHLSLSRIWRQEINIQKRSRNLEAHRDPLRIKELQHPLIEMKNGKNPPNVELNQNLTNRIQTVASQRLTHMPWKKIQKRSHLKILAKIHRMTKGGFSTIRTFIR
ncbi:hypothetical protein BLNAU_20541 [Blattamonas nauphoetae]|uniref:Uncharacterized protein n=1 Tax=Blattamonas nauphoetae TaxID=2049346 RepID=A0ABQ9WYJ0_9EUKA|nr:hypothetical protein BLNAU_20541 [Blattamonas nauphoetae]